MKLVEIMHWRLPKPMVTPGRMSAPAPTQTSESDIERLAVLHLAAQGGVEGVHRRQHLNPRGELCLVE